MTSVVHHTVKCKLNFFPFILNLLAYLAQIKPTLVLKLFAVAVLK